MQATLLSEWRRDTRGCAHRLHLNNAGAALMPRPVVDAVMGHLALERRPRASFCAGRAASMKGDTRRPIDMNGASWSSTGTFKLVDSARRFEQWEQPSALVLGLGDAAEYAMRVGLKTAAARAPMLAARLRARLAAVPGWRVLDDRPHASAIVAVELGAVDPPLAVEALRKKAINTSATFRAWAQYHMGRQGVEAALRISPHYYNSENEIDRFVPALYDVTRTV
jgi:selenocysteine lyase/cysteine desulfurase